MANEISTQIVREAEPIERAKLELMQAAAGLQMPTLPAYEVAGFSPEQIQAIRYGVEGIGAYQPWLSSGASSVTSGMGTMQQAADVLRGTDTRNQFQAAQQAMLQAANPISAMSELGRGAGAGLGYLGQAGQGLTTAQQLALANAAQPGFQQGVGALYQGAQQGQQAVGQAGALTQAGIGALYDAAQRAQAAAQGLGQAPTVQAQQVGTPTMQAAQMGPAERVSTQSFAAPGSAQAYMSPYMQDVVAAQQREARRASDIQQTQEQAAAARSGAFGGGRQAIMAAERQRNLATQLGDIQAAGLQQAYQQAQNQFNVEQQARLAAQQANQQAGLTVGTQNLSAQQQAAVQNQAAALQAQGMNAQQALQAALANQQMQAQYGVQGAQLGMQAADVLRQAGIGTLGGAQQLGTLGLQGAGMLQGAGQGQIGAAGQQGQLGQGAAGLYGQLAGQQANLAGQYAGVAGQQANILAQQSQLGQALGQGIGNLAGQQFGIGSQLAQGLGALGTQMGNIGMQLGSLGQAGQQMGQQDVSFLYNLGAEQQRQQQAALDAQRATALQTSSQPFQKLAFMSDIYRGAPSSQMAMTAQAAPTPSPFQQIAGLGIAALGTAGAAKSAGLI